MWAAHGNGPDGSGRERLPSVTGNPAFEWNLLSGGAGGRWDKRRDATMGLDEQLAELLARLGVVLEDAPERESRTEQDERDERDGHGERGQRGSAGAASTRARFSLGRRRGGATGTYRGAGGAFALPDVARALRRVLSAGPGRRLAATARLRAGRGRRAEDGLLPGATGGGQPIGCVVPHHPRASRLGVLR